MKWKRKILEKKKIMFNGNWDDASSMFSIQRKMLKVRAKKKKKKQMFYAKTFSIFFL